MELITLLAPDLVIRESYFAIMSENSVWKSLMELTNDKLTFDLGRFSFLLQIVHVKIYIVGLHVGAVSFV